MSEGIEQRRRAIRESVERAGGIVAFRKALSVTHQGVYYWIKVGHVPVDKALQIEALFGTPRADIVEPKVAAALAAPSGADLV